MAKRDAYEARREAAQRKNQARREAARRTTVPVTRGVLIDRGSFDALAFGDSSEIESV